ncbi:MAG: hypothetical protein H2174_09550 [Vampirovibrio sp.]|nr:hypothetical protein [Vampirovibrio sp.]
MVQLNLPPSSINNILPLQQVSPRTSLATMDETEPTTTTDDFTYNTPPQADVARVKTVKKPMLQRIYPNGQPLEEGGISLLNTGLGALVGGLIGATSAFMPFTETNETTAQNRSVCSEDSSLTDWDFDFNSFFEKDFDSEGYNIDPKRVERLRQKLQGWLENSNGARAKFRNPQDGILYKIEKSADVETPITIKSLEKAVTVTTKNNKDERFKWWYNPAQEKQQLDLNVSMVGHPLSNFDVLGKHHDINNTKLSFVQEKDNAFFRLYARADSYFEVPVDLAKKTMEKNKAQWVGNREYYVDNTTDKAIQRILTYLESTYDLSEVIEACKQPQGKTAEQLVAFAKGTLKIEDFGAAKKVRNVGAVLGITVGLAALGALAGALFFPKKPESPTAPKANQ